MGFAHILNLYKDQDILLFKECYSSEKIDGESAHVKLKRGEDLEFFAGNSSLVTFKALFDATKLKAHLESMGAEEVTIHGEVYGGAIAHMSHMYGDKMCFTAFDLCLDRLWLPVPQMHEVLTSFGIEVVPYVRIPTDVAAIDAQRDLPSEISVRRGISGPHPREGVVLRPLIEVTKNNGERVICKHKTEKHSERKTTQKVDDPSKLKVLEDAKAIADEWVTENRLKHVLSKLPPTGATITMKDVQPVIKAMQEDVTREASGEIVVSKEALVAISKRTVELFKALLTP